MLPIRLARRLPALMLVLLAGCGRFYPAVPTPAELSRFSAEIDSLRLEPSAILARGVALVDHNCATFFDGLQRRRQMAEFGGSQVAAAASAASAILAIAGAGAPAIGHVAAGAGFAAVTVQNIERTALLTEFPDELQNLVLDAQAQFLRGLAERRLQPQSAPAAYAEVVGYARLCTLPQIRSLARQALGSARLTEAGPAGPDTLAGASRLMGFRATLAAAQVRALLDAGAPPLAPASAVALRATLGPAFAEVFVIRGGAAELRPEIAAADYARGLAALRRLAEAAPQAAPRPQGGPMSGGWFGAPQGFAPTQDPPAVNAVPGPEALPQPLPRIRVAP